MRRALLVVLAAVLVAPAQSAQQAPPLGQGLVGSWLLTSMQLDGKEPARLQGARGLLVFDAAGHALELVARTDPQPYPNLTEAQSRFYSVGGSWGRYEADLPGGRITFRPQGGVSPNVAEGTFSRLAELAGDRLTLTSRPGELHTQGVTQWIWERVPNLAGLSAGYLDVVGFWQHEIEGRRDAATGEVLSETTRAPSVIVYTPAGFVGVHFPTRDRPRFAGREPTDAEARKAGGYLGYFAALGVYPGMVFHNILGGGVASGSTLRRFYERRGDQLHLTFPPGTGRDGRRTSTYVRLRRLSDANDMLGR